MRSKVPFDFMKLFCFYIVYYIKQIFYLINRKLLNRNLLWSLALIDANQNIIKQFKYRNKFWADPFPIKHNGKYFIFFEEMNLSTQKGEISCIQLNNKFEFENHSIVLKGENHFSFPNVFKHNDEFYMLPENSESNNLIIFKSYNFPFDWRPYKILIQGIKLLDPICFYYKGTFWLLANKVNEYEYDNNHSLYLYFSDDLFSNSWCPHPLNPIVSDSRFSRNAGRIIFKGEKLFRVSQNCFVNYGSQINFMEICEISKIDYSEKLVSHIHPIGNSKGVHTYNEIDELAWVDLLY